jgi:hypothetical protein
MGNLRRLQRQAAKKQYKEFCKNWATAIKEQSKLDTQGNRLRLSEKRKERYAERGEPILGQRPSFNQWWAAVKTPQQAKDATPEEVQEHIESLEWDEDDGE